MERPEYVRIKFKDIPKEFLDEYHLENKTHNDWIYFEIVTGAYGLPQSGRLANDQLRERLAKAGYYEAVSTPGLWRHVWRPVQFILIVDDFAVEYVGKKHAQHLADTLKQYHKISEDWEGKRFAGINLKWNYAKVHRNRSCKLSMNDYIKELLLHLGHPMPGKPQCAPQKWREIKY